MISVSSYIDVSVDTSPDNLATLAFDYMQEKFPGWSPAAANLDTVMVEALALIAAEVRDVASRVPRTIFRTYGASIMNILPLDAVAATGQTTWTMVDDAGYTIDAGTLIGLRAAGDVLTAFRTVNAVVVSPGNVTTAVGEVYIQAAELGVSGNGLGDPVELIDSLDYVELVSVTGPTTGGQDAESDDDYLGRLSDELQLLAPTPILPQDFAVLAKFNIAGVGRAIALDGYNPVDLSYLNERMVTVVAIDEAGNGVSAPIKAEISAYLESLREVNFVVNVDDPEYTIIDVDFEVVITPGFTTAVATDVADALSDFLRPTLWGLSETGSEWRNAPVVRYLEVAQVINQTSGVDYITTLLINKLGDTPATSDVIMAGAAPLPLPGTITGSVVGS